MFRMCEPADRLFLIFSIFHSQLKRIDQLEGYRILFLDMFSLKRDFTMISLNDSESGIAANHTTFASSYRRVPRPDLDGRPWIGTQRALLTSLKTYMIGPIGSNLSSTNRMDHSWRMHAAKTHSKLNVVEAWISILVSERFLFNNFRPICWWRDRLKNGQRSTRIGQIANDRPGISLRHKLLLDLYHILTKWLSLSMKRFSMHKD